jgi:hypothetical protein
METKDNQNCRDLIKLGTNPARAERLSTSIVHTSILKWLIASNISTVNPANAGKP